MTDRELLELAAKAAGIVIKRSRLDDPAMKDMLIEANREAHSAFIGWNPLTDDGDALQLAVKLRMNIRHYSITHEGPDRVGIDNGYGIYPVLYGADPYAATRRAIVRAAAEIGKAVQKPLAP